MPPGLRTALRGCRSPRRSGVPFPAGCPRRRPAGTPPAPGCRRPAGRQRQLPACTAADELADAEAQLCAAEEAAVVLDRVFLHQAAAVVFYPERDARLFLFQAHPHPAACIAGPQRVGDEVEQQLFGLIGDAHDGAVLDAPALRRQRYFQRPLDVRGKTPRLFQQTAQVQRLQLAQLFISS